MPTAPLSISLVLLLILNLLAVPAWAQDKPAALQIRIVEGDGAINNVKQRLTHEPVVQVEDENHRPIAGAAVVFFLPTSGPRGTFSNGSSTLTTTTNAQGQASAAGIQFVNLAGPMQIRVTASYAGQTASIVIDQTNVIGNGSTGGTSNGGLSSAAKWAILIGAIGAGAAVGAVLATKGGSSNSGSSTSPSVTLTPGTVTVGAP